MTEAPKRKRRKAPPGLRLRGKVYYAWLTYRGVAIRKRLASDVTAATEMLNDIKAKIDRREWGFIDNSETIDAIRKQYLENCRQRLRPSSVESIERNLRKILGTLNVKTVDVLTPALIESYRRDRLDQGRSPRTINLEVGTLQAMLNWAADKKRKLIGSNPIEGLSPLPHTPKEGRAMTDDEVRRLLEASPDPWKDIWYAYLTTGLRKTELASLRWRDVDWESREIIVRSTVAKNKTSRRIPIDNHLWDILQVRRDAVGDRKPGTGKTPTLTAMIEEKFTRDHVFTTSANTPLTHRHGVYGAFIRYAKKAGIEVKTLDDAGEVIDHVDVHSLRRTFATNLITNGADPKSVQTLMGHKTLAMTMNLYAKIHVTTKREAIGRLSYGGGVTHPGIAGPVVRFPTPKGTESDTKVSLVAVAST